MTCGIYTVDGVDERSVLLRCPCCGGHDFVRMKVLWPALIEGWGLSEFETALIEEQQGLSCSSCKANLRAMALAIAIMRVFHVRGLFRSFALQRPWLRVLEVNQVNGLERFLHRLPRHTLTTYPAVDFMNLPMADNSYDLVVHSEVLEHVPAPLTALREAYRVLRPGGFTCYTIPLLVTRLTTGTEGKPPTFHGSEAETDEGLMVRTEYGADAWAQAAQAGFHEVRLFPLRHPAAVAIAARKPG